MMNPYRWKRLPLPKPSFDVIFGALLPGVGEKFLTFGGLHQFTLQEEGGKISRPGSLLDRVRYQDDGVILLQFLQAWLRLCRSKSGRDRRWVRRAG